ncbi:hypothetical protein HYX06_00840 [Candidatus Woesearchaeota archaeon]|nr:hypothetical protein [Candidatus Woesearchaeota archaeon]
MNQPQLDPFVAEVKARLESGGEVGKFYILNLIVPPLDGSRVIGPLTEQSLRYKKSQYDSLMQRASPEEAQKLPFVAFKCIDEAVFEPYQI